MTSISCLRLIQNRCSRSAFNFSSQYFCKKINISPIASFHSINPQVQNSNWKPLEKGSISKFIARTSTSHTSHDHVAHWSAERILTILMASSIPAAIYIPPAEYFLAFALVLHAHWGIEGIVIDYIRPSIFGTLIPKLSVGAVYALSAFALGSLFYFIYTDVGMINAVRLLWKM